MISGINIHILEKIKCILTNGEKVMPIDEEMGLEDSVLDRKQLKEEKKRLKAEQKEQKKLAKQRAKEIASKEE